MVDIHGDHCLLCLWFGAVVHRHDDLVRLIHLLARAGFVDATREHKVDFKDDAGKTRTWKADLWFPRPIPGVSTRPTALDITVTSEFGHTIVKACGKAPGKAASYGEKRKNDVFLKPLSDAGIDFVPIAFEVSGGLAPSASPLISYLLQQKALVTNTPYSEVAAEFWQSLSLTLQRANAYMIADRTGPLPDIATDY